MPGTPSLRPQTSLQRRLIAAFTERLMLKATAVFLAIILWLVVNAKEPQIELVAVRFMPVLLDSSLVLRDQLPQFQAIVAGSPKELIKLNSALPTIRRQITADAPDTLVVDLRPEDVVLPDGVDAVVRDVQPRSLTLRFEPTWTRRVRIASSGIQVITLPGVPLVRPQFDPETVQISGPRHLVIKIAQVQTVKTTIPYPDSLAHLVDIDTTALGASVRVKPAQVKVHLP
jgi:YbbR domain-containing protein